MNGTSKIKNRKDAIKVARLLKHLIEINEVSKLLTAFIPAFLYKTVLKMGKYFLHGNFHLGGTKSGRLSSSKINLQQLPSTGSKFAKVIKECFQAPEGWVIVGADFSSLEDRISALTTKDPNKLKVYTDGYDGHCMRAFAYFGKQMPDIIDTVESINSIEVMYEALRQRSKGPTFALTYQGTSHTLVNTLGFSNIEAMEIEENYHKLYKVSDDWVQDKLIQASKDGYVTGAFGLRLRTPLLAKTILNTRHTPFEAQSEGRTAGNALGQSYGLLNNRAANEFMDKVHASEYRYSILPIAHIHDAQYYMVKADLDLVHWLNINLVDSMSWQDLPELEHDLVKLGATLEIYYPNMGKKTTIVNNASKAEILHAGL
jgi:DNA polymerase-1|tara:strand:+ start:2430 stop:3545 length:1116 start_codon:yes stop_codon:yes gene_type:complete